MLAVVDHRLRHGDGAGAWQALFPVLGALDRRGMYGELVSAATRVLAAVPEDSNEAASVLGHLGQAWYSLGEIGQGDDHLRARPRHRRGAPLARGPGPGPRRPRALPGGRGAWADAIAFHQRAAGIHEVIGERRAFADDLGNVGLALRHVGDVAAPSSTWSGPWPSTRTSSPGTASPRCSAASASASATSASPRAPSSTSAARSSIHEARGRSVGQATMLGNLGNTFRTVGDVPAAISHLERALAIYERLGLLEGQGAALGNLGNCYKRTDKPKARDYFERALAVLRRVGLPDDHPHVKAVLAALTRPRRR